MKTIISANDFIKNNNSEKEDSDRFPICPGYDYCPGYEYCPCTTYEKLRSKVRR